MCEKLDCCDDGACANQLENVERAGAGKDSYNKGGKEGVKADIGNRARSASMRWMEWLIRPKGACSPP